MQRLMKPTHHDERARVGKPVSLVAGGPSHSDTCHIRHLSYSKNKRSLMISTGIATDVAPSIVRGQARFVKMEYMERGQGCYDDSLVHTIGVVHSADT